MDKYAPSYATYVHVHVYIADMDRYTPSYVMYMYIPAHSLAIPQRLHLGSIIYLHVYCVAHR